MNNAAIPVLHTERLKLRRLSLPDAADIHSYASDPLVTRYVAWERHKSMNDTLNYLKEFVETGYSDGTLYDWGICLKDTDKVIGTCGIPARDRVNGWGMIGYVLSKEYWGKGIAAEAVQEVIRFGFEVLGLVRIEAFCRIENTASERVMQKSGMTFEGTLRKRLFKDNMHHDVKIYAIVNNTIP